MGLEHVSRAQLEMAAYAGHTGAAAALGKRVSTAKPGAASLRRWMNGVHRWGLDAMIHSAAPTGSIAVATFAKARKGDRRLARAWRVVVAAMRGKAVDVRAALEPLIAMRREPWFMKSARVHCSVLTVLRLGQALCAERERDWVANDMKQLGLPKGASADTVAARAVTDAVMACVAATSQLRRVQDAVQTMLARYALKASSV